MVESEVVMFVSVKPVTKAAVYIDRKNYEKVKRKCYYHLLLVLLLLTEFVSR